MPLTTVPFDTWTVKEIEEALKKVNPEYIKRNRLYFEGDHWQNGDGWIGPLPLPTSTTVDGYNITLELIKKGFSSRNVIAEVVERHASGVLGKEPSWGLTLIRPLKENEEPNPTEQALIDEAHALLTEWWDKRKILTYLQERCYALLYAKRSPLRLYVPGGLLEPDGSVAAADLRDALLTYIFPSQPLVEQATVYTEPTTQRDVGIFSWLVEDKTQYEIVYAHPVDPTITVIRTFAEAGEKRYELPYNGALTMYEMKRQLLITDQVVQNQKAVNLAVSVMPRNVVSAGWLERVILGGQMPGKWEKDANGKDIFKPEPYITGPGTTNFIAGQETEDDDGKVKAIAPSVVYREPIPIDAAKGAEREHYTIILEETDQAHALMDGDGTPSGRSREQARADYEASLLLSAAPVAEAGRWILTAALHMAEGLSGSVGRYTSQLRAYFEPVIDTGPASADERMANREDYKEGVISRETAMVRNNVTDTAAEIERINAQPGANLELIARQAEIMVPLTSAGLSLEGAAELVELSPEQIAIIKKHANSDLGGTEEENDDDKPFPNQ